MANWQHASCRVYIDHIIILLHACRVSGAVMSQKSVLT